MPHGQRNPKKLWKNPEIIKQIIDIPLIHLSQQWKDSIEEKDSRRLIIINFFSHHEANTMNIYQKYIFIIIIYHF